MCHGKATKACFDTLTLTLSLTLTLTLPPTLTLPQGVLRGVRLRCPHRQGPQAVAHRGRVRGLGLGLGVGVVIDKDLKPWLIEVNVACSLASSSPYTPTPPLTPPLTQPRSTSPAPLLPPPLWTSASRTYS